MLWASGSGSAETGLRVGQVGDVEDLDPLLVADEGVAELDLDRRGCFRNGSPTTDVTLGCFGSSSATTTRPASQQM